MTHNHVYFRRRDVRRCSRSRSETRSANLHRTAALSNVRRRFRALCEDRLFPRRLAEDAAVRLSSNPPGRTVALLGRLRRATTRCALGVLRDAARCHGSFLGRVFTVGVMFRFVRQLRRRERKSIVRTIPCISLHHEPLTLSRMATKRGVAINGVVLWQNDLGSPNRITMRIRFMSFSVGQQGRFI